MQVRHYFLKNNFTYIYKTQFLNRVVCRGYFPKTASCSPAASAALHVCVWDDWSNDGTADTPLVSNSATLRLRAFTHGKSQILCFNDNSQKFGFTT